MHVHIIIALYKYWVTKIEFLQEIISMFYLKDGDDVILNIFLLILGQDFLLINQAK